MKFILGTKESMTQIFDETGKVTPVTVISAGPLVVTQVKTKDKDGYDAVQVGYGERKLKSLAKAQQGHIKGLSPKDNVGFRFFKEFKATGFNRGDELLVSTFEPGEEVVVAGITKGKGFQGVVKRHGFAGGRRSHGQKHSEREPGSIGATAPQRVLKGTRMGGRMGADRVTVKNLKVVKVLPESNQIIISGAVPGRRGTLIEIIAK